MKIQCPKCSQVIPPDQVNVAVDVALCPQCNEAFKVSDLFDQDTVDPDLLKNPPNGAWFRKEMDQIVVGATTRSPIAFILVPFMCVWSGGSIGGIYGSQIISGKFNLLLSLFGIPFLIGSIIFWTFAFMAICGKVEVTIGRISSVFVGIGKAGWKKYFDWSSVKAIREGFSYNQYPGSNQGLIVIESKEPFKFGTGLNENRRYFILNVLKYLKAEERLEKN
jgi:hypothetical protein